MPSAVRDLEDYADFIAADSPDQAQKWLQGAWKKIFSLAEMPKRFAVIAESDFLVGEIRDLTHHSHRIVYRMKDTDGVVEVLRVWHSARRNLHDNDLG